MSLLLPRSLPSRLRLCPALARWSREARRIIAFQPTYNLGKTVWSAGPVKIADMRPDTALHFLSPFSKDMQDYYKLHKDRATSEEKEDFLYKAEAYSRYNLIRLPEQLGGKQDAISSFRAYSAVAISNSCITRYWGDDRERIEDPCHGDIFRPWDGLAIAGPAAAGVSHGIVDRAETAALANLDLALDKEGYIVAFKPDLAANGVVGAGRNIDVDKESEAMLAAASKYASYDLPFPASITGYHLTTIAPATIQWDHIAKGRTDQLAATYFDDSSMGTMIEVAAYPVDQFPELKSAALEIPLNMTTVQYLANPSMNDTASGTGIAGRYAHVWVADGYGSAAVLGVKGDRELFVTIRVQGMVDSDRIIALARSLALD